MQVHVLFRAAPADVYELQLAALFDGRDVLREEAGLFASVRLGGPLPMVLVAPIGGVLEGRCERVAMANDATAAMVEVQVGQEHIRHIIARESGFFKRTVKRVITMQVVVPEEFGVLLVADAIVDQDQSSTIFHQQTAHRPGAEVVRIGRMVLAPKCLRHHTEHGTTVELEETGIDHM